MQKKLEVQNIQLRQEIADRRQAEKLLQEKEARYRAIVEAFDGFIYICSQDYRVEFMNERFIERTGYNGTGEMCYKVIHDRDSICPWCVNDQVFNGETVHWEVQSPKDNSWFYVVNTPIYHPNGSISKQSMILDISEHKQAEEKLKKSEENYQTLVENLNVGVYRNTGDPHGRFIQANPAIARIFGYDSVDEFMEVNVSDLYEDAEDRKSFVNTIAQTGSVKNKELQLKRKGGESIWASVSASAHYDQNGNINCIDGVIEDITERKRVEEELQEAHENLERLVEDRTAELSRKNRQLVEEIEVRKRVEGQLRNSEEKYRNIFENIQDIYYEIGFDGIIHEISPSVERITKYNRDELIGKSVYEIYAYPEERDEFLKIIKKTGMVTDHEVTIKDRDGSLLTASLCSRLVVDKEGNPSKILGSIRDITKRKMAEEDLRASEEKYRSVVDNVGIGIALISQNMEILTLNNQMKKWFPNIDVFDKPICYKAFNKPPRENVCSYCPTYKTLQDGQVHESVTETPVGPETINYRVVSSPIKGKDGKIIAAIEMVEDITESKKMQERLRESEIYYRTIFETTGAGTMIIEEDTTISLVNDEFEKLTGYTKNEIEGKKNWTEFVVKDDLARMKEYHYLRRIDPNAAPRNYEYRFIDRAGNVRNIFMTVAMIPGTKKSMVSNLDITELKHAEEAVRESEKRLSDIIDFLPDATFAVDQDRKVIAWNRAVEEMTGTKAEEILGKGDYEYALPFYGIRKPLLMDLIFKSDEEIEKKYVYLKKEADVILGETDVHLKRGSRTLWGKARPLYDSKGCIVGAIQSIRDITERRRAEKALKKRERELEVKSRNLEELNTALKVLLKQREADKDELEERTLSNVKHLVLPYIEKLKKSNLEDKDDAYISIIETNLKDIVSPFSQRLSSKYVTFTPKELQVANLIKEGKTTKEIAEMLNTSPGTIDFHRNNIRRKLNLKKRRANLRSYLLTLS